MFFIFLSASTFADTGSTLDFVNKKKLIEEQINNIQDKLDDNSQDNIKQVFNTLKKKYKFLKLFIRKNKKKDLSKSCIFGFDKSSFKNILVI